MRNDRSDTCNRETIDRVCSCSRTILKAQSDREKSVFRILVIEAMIASFENKILFREANFILTIM